MDSLTTVAVIFSYVLSLLRISVAVDTIIVNQNITDGETITSAGGSFELGFFSPGNSKNRYLGIWYKKASKKPVVWVANRESPITDSSGVLKVTQPGILVLVNGTNGILWNSTSSRSAQDPNAQLLESGNLVMRNGNDRDPENFLWQSFDYPCDTLLPGMKLGRNRVAGLDRYLSSWKSADDPSKGNFTYWIDPSGFPQLLLRNGLAVAFRPGPWNGIRFSGVPQLTINPVYSYEYISNEKEIYFIYYLVNSSVIMRLVLTPDGAAQRSTWTDQKNEWTLYSTAQRDQCHNYAICGVNGICKIDQSPNCECMKGFRPKFQSNWDMAYWSDGCVRSTPLDCQKGDGFVKYSGVKLPDTRSSWFNESMNLKECASLCLSNCSCTAYANSDIRGGGSGCLLWFGDLIDIRDFTENGQEFYVRMAAADLDQMRSKVLDWLKRFLIINGIARGLLYFHQDSRLRIIHRDLKAENILLDNDMIPKISNFGITGSFGGNEIETNTTRVARTLGYMSPEYASEGLYSTKSNVFSFGVLVLEIVSGKRNTIFNHPYHDLSLLGHAWTFFMEDRSSEFIDASMGNTYNLFEVLHSINLGLLCVQCFPEDRPSMHFVVLMLGSEGALPQPKEPYFFTDMNMMEGNSSSGTQSTITLLEA